MSSANASDASSQPDSARDDNLLAALKALASQPRLQVLRWLRDPRAHFPEQVDGDLVEDGVCAVFLADKLGVSAPTLHQHMTLLLRAELVRSRKIKQWTFYRRNEARLEEIARAIGDSV